MAYSIEDLKEQLIWAIQPGFKGRLLDRGLARGMIWQDGVLPEGSPPFSENLTDDLLDYAYGLFSLALNIRSLDHSIPELNKAFIIVGESIESVVHRGKDSTEIGFHRICSSISFHLARYSARAYSILPAKAELMNLSPSELLIYYILRRDFSSLHEIYLSWLQDENNDDSIIASRLKNDDEFFETDAIHLILTTAFMKSIALFDQAIRNGELHFIDNVKERLRVIIQNAAELNAVQHWWIFTLAYHLIEELWDLSFFNQIPILPADEFWNFLRISYIHRLRSSKRSSIEAWPSQIEAIKRSVNPEDDLVIALPTSAGKTRIAEICILRTLSSNKRVVYVTPLRALSAQIERDLSEIFIPLGFSISSLYGTAGVSVGDSEPLRSSSIVVATPEKIDFAIRNDPSIINDVGLIVLDEGHMLGPSEREVRYEVLIQRLLRRSDSVSRRIVCLSALFPTPNEMYDFVSWIRQDEPGVPIHSYWRPTRQRYGLLQWSTDHARLDVIVEQEHPYIEQFIEETMPPTTSRRRNPFPFNKNELSLATAWKYIKQEKNVLIYCTQKASVEPLGRLILKCIKQNVLEPFRRPSTLINNAMLRCKEWLGPNHIAIQCLQYGIVLHHASLPRPFLNEVESLLRNNECPLVIASPTLSQGLNITASVLLIPSLWRNKKIIKPIEFANVAGRAGRAYVDIEGLVIHVIWENDLIKRKRRIKEWNNLVQKSKAPEIWSGILQLLYKIYDIIAQTSDVPLDELIDYITGNSHIWDYNTELSEKLDITSTDWERDIASFDLAILSSINSDVEQTVLLDSLTEIFEKSLFFRQLAHIEENISAVLRHLLLERINLIWSETSTNQRKAYQAAGIGLKTGKVIDSNLDILMGQLINAEAALNANDFETGITLIINFASIVFQIPPFANSSGLPDNWENSLSSWLNGAPTLEVINACGEDGVDFLQKDIIYRLPWAMEAIRVHGLSLGYEGAETIQGTLALSVEVGSTNMMVILLLRNGLTSREAAIASIESLSPNYNDLNGLNNWLDSAEVKDKTNDSSWPSDSSHYEWVNFYESRKNNRKNKWEFKKQTVKVIWDSNIPPADLSVIVDKKNDSEICIVYSMDYIRLGVLESDLLYPLKNIIKCSVTSDTNKIIIDFYGE